MADIPIVKTRKLTREILSTFLKNHELIKAFENLMQDVSVTLPEATLLDRTAIEVAQADADAAQLTADGAVLDAAAAQADVDAHEAATGTAVHGLGTSSILNIDIDGALAANSDLLLPTQKAVKTYADGLVTAAGAVIGPASAVDNNVALFNGATGKIIKDSGLTLSGNNTGDQTITLTGDATGSGTGSFSVTLASTGVPSGAYGSATRATIFTVDAKGRLTAASDALITPAFSSLTGKPTTATGYGIASIDAVPIGATTPSTAAFTTVNGTTGTFSGNLYSGATSVIAAAAGRNYVAVRGSSGAGVVELSTAAADADNVLTGLLQFADLNSINADKKSAFIAGFLSGATATDRGSILTFATKINGGAIAEAMRITNGQRLLIGTTTDDGTNKLQVAGNVAVVTVGAGVRIKEGSNAKQGTAVLVAGTVTVANTSITASSRIQLTSNADGGTPGWLRVSARVAGTSFTITSSSAADTSTVAYFITEPA